MRGARSSTQPTTARVFHSRLASPQPTRPWSVSTLTKTQLRIRALTTRVEMAAIFTRPLPSSARPPHPPSASDRLGQGKGAGRIPQQLLRDPLGVVDERLAGVEEGGDLRSAHDRVVAGQQQLQIERPQGAD